MPRLNLLPLILQKLACRAIARSVCRHIGWQRPDLVWTFDLARFPDLGIWQASVSLLHLVELFDHPMFLDAHRHRREILRTADHVVTIADMISDQIRPQRPDVVTMNHGADLNGFERATKLKGALPGAGAVKAGLVGNFQVSFDFTLLERLSSMCPQVDFLLMGPHQGSNLGDLHQDAIEGIQRVRHRKNVFFLGVIPPGELMSYLREVDINIIIYKDEFVNGHCNPHKMMGYFYAGRAIVSSYVDAYRGRPDLVWLAHGSAEFPALFKKALEQLEDLNSPTNSSHRRQFARENSYESRIREILRLVNAERNGTETEKEAIRA